MVSDVLAEYRRMQGRKMMKATLEQVAELHEQIKAERITRENLQAFLRSPNSVFGNNMILAIDRSRPFNPAEFIGKGWSIAEQDERSLALSKVDLAKVNLVTMLKDRETRVQGEEKLIRLKKSGHIRLDAKAFQAFWENKTLIPEGWKEKTAVYFDGTVLRDPYGYRCVLCLDFGGGEWGWRCFWLEFGWGAGYPSAVLAE